MDGYHCWVQWKEIAVAKIICQYNMISLHQDISQRRRLDIYQVVMYEDSVYAAAVNAVVTIVLLDVSATTFSVHRCVRNFVSLLFF